MTASNAPSPRGQTISQRWFVPSILILLIVVFDQITKLWIIQTLGPLPMSRSIVLIDDWLRLVYVQNTGIAFGLFRDLSPLFTVTSLVIAAGVVYTYMFHLPSHNMWVKISIGLILGGALGNVIDRIRLSFVVDFISVGWFPTFNVADSGVSIGVGILALYLLLADDIEPRRVSSEDTALLQELLGRDVRQRD